MFHVCLFGLSCSACKISVAVVSRITTGTPFWCVFTFLWTSMQFQRAIWKEGSGIDKDTVFSVQMLFTLVCLVRSRCLSESNLFHHCFFFFFWVKLRSIKFIQRFPFFYYANSNVIMFGSLIFHRRLNAFTIEPVT